MRETKNIIPIIYIYTYIVSSSILFNKKSNVDTPGMSNIYFSLFYKTTVQKKQNEKDF